MSIPLPDPGAGEPLPSSGSPAFDSAVERRLRALEGNQDEIASQAQVYNSTSRRLNVATEESTTSTSYTTLTTPDQVTNVKLNDAGALQIVYYANWKGSAPNNVRAAIFLNSTQLSVFRGSVGGPVTQAAAISSASSSPSSIADTYVPLVTNPTGLISLASDNAVTTGFSTGQAIGWATTNGAQMAQEISGAVFLHSNTDSKVYGGVLVVHADPGTYTVSVQFKTSSGTVTVRDRHLWVSW